jgi:hypothetical protein
MKSTQRCPNFPIPRAAVVGPLMLVLASWALEPSAADESKAAAGVEQPVEQSGEMVDPRTERSKPGKPELGRWRKFRSHRSDPNLSPEQVRMIENLEALGYMSGSVAGSGERGVTKNDSERAWRGLNFYTSGHAPGAILVDMDGNELHHWRYSFTDAFPSSDIAAPERLKSFWRRAYLYENGDVLAIFDGRGIIKLDKDSKLLWAALIGAHHDLQVMPGGEILVLAREARMIPRIRTTTPILEDFISVLDAHGKETKRVSLLECFENSEFKELVLGDHVQQEDVRAALRWRLGDLFHTNSLEVLDGRIAARVPEFAKGNILVSLWVPSLLAVVDLDRKTVVWAMKGTFKRQHDPKILVNGNMLLFDNQGRPLQSSVIELDPADRTVRWEYVGTKADPFFTESCGTAERLPNGNTLITESDNGRAFEVTAEKQVVWEFYNPFRAGDQGEYIATLFEVVRLPPDFPVGWADGPAEPLMRGSSTERPDGDGQ